jgi:hypothetical protein
MNFIFSLDPAIIFSAKTHLELQVGLAAFEGQCAIRVAQRYGIVHGGKVELTRNAIKVVDPAAYSLLIDLKSLCTQFGSANTSVFLKSTVDELRNAIIARTDELNCRFQAV